MKLDFLAEKEKIFKINDMLPREARWPFLKQILSETDSKIKFISKNAEGQSIFIGWGLNPGRARGHADEWFYHHTISLISYPSPVCYFGLHKHTLEQALKNAITIKPVFSVGKLPESKKFIKILRSFGIKACAGMLPLRYVELNERDNNN